MEAVSGTIISALMLKLPPHVEAGVKNLRPHRTVAISTGFCFFADQNVGAARAIQHRY